MAAEGGQRAAAPEDQDTTTFTYESCHLCFRHVPLETDTTMLRLVPEVDTKQDNGRLLQLQPGGDKTCRLTMLMAAPLIGLASALVLSQGMCWWQWPNRQHGGCASRGQHCAV